VKYYLSVLLLLAACFWAFRQPSSGSSGSDSFFQQLQQQHVRNVERRKRIDLIRFFDRYNCPAINYQLIPNYLESADRYNLDYRLLPAISLAESTCLKRYPADTFNPYGWNSARTGFASLPSAIDFISGQLANGYFYAGKTIEQKLRAFNNNPAYAPRVLNYMREIAINP